jgi:paraquat-inducible protein A
LAKPASGSLPVIACGGCGTVHKRRPIPPGTVADCLVCGSPLYRHKPKDLQLPLALHAAALVMLTVAISFPLLSFSLEGRTQTASILTGIELFWAIGYWPLALVVGMVGIIVPAVRALMALLVLGSLLLGLRPRFAGPTFRWVEILRPWAMMEVYLLGLTVAYVKLQDLARLELGLAAFAFVALILLTLMADALMDRARVWERLEPQARPVTLRPLERIVACHACHQLVPLPAQILPICPRCGAALHRRKPYAVARTWALLITAVILYIPANVLPVMTVVYFGHGEPDTILSGVRALIAAGMWPVAALVFFASIMVPVLKIVGLVWLLLGVQRGVTDRPRQRTFVYRIVEGIGRWSMVDIFMISILVGLVNLGAIATIFPGPGALSFAAVVILTMLAAETFDPRLIWDARARRGFEDASVRV